MATKINTVLITGASSGIGLDIAKAFLRRGSNVVLNARNETKLNDAASKLSPAERIAVVPGDIGLKETGEEMVRVAVERFGSVDVLVNSAGIFAPKPFLENSEEDLDAFLATNLKGTFFASQAAIAQMRQQGGGAIINVGTVQIGQAIVGMPASAALASKGAVHALTTSLAAEFAADKIRVNAIAPGVIRTPIFGDADVDSFAGIHPLNRVGEVQDTTEAVLYLADSDFTTGVILPVDGGFLAARA